MIDYTLILERRYAGEQWALNGDDYTGLVWISDTPKPSQQTLDNLWLEVQNELLNEQTQAATDKTALLAKLGITADEAKLLLS
jgi:hypothetical protein